MHAFVDFIIHFGIIAVLFVIFAESGLLFGFIFPGDSLLFTAGYMVQQHILPIDISIFVLLLIIAAIAGDSVGYTFGHKVGRKLFAGKALTEAGINVEVAALIIIFLSVLPMIIHALKQESTKAALKKQLSVLFSKDKQPKSAAKKRK